ncbi:hypothetical protein V9T40_014725 [Parthenolecanium corni]|uniref:Uncharacterized protein n=1 Tax=Parthenolecanium corni TaxID=536013 RepID=A0AAN9T6I9_9HEMI
MGGEGSGVERDKELGRLKNTRTCINQAHQTKFLTNSIAINKTTTNIDIMRSTTRNAERNDQKLYWLMTIMKVENKRSAYTAKDLKGLKVEHSMDAFAEERAVVLTLKDKGVLDENEDSLVNVNMLDDERYKKNLDRRRQKQKYDLYEDDEFAEIESQLDKKVLSETARIREEARKEALKNKLQQYAVGKRLENLSVALQPATEYYTEQEMQCKFKKFKKRVKKVRKAKPLKADDLLRVPVKPESNDDALNYGSRRATSSRTMKLEPAVKDEPDLDTDDLPAPLPIDTGKIKVEMGDEDDHELQFALHRSRRSMMAESLEPQFKANFTDDISMEDSKEVPGASGSIVLNSTDRSNKKNIFQDKYSLL